MSGRKLPLNKTLETEMDDSWRSKGHIHKQIVTPKVCQACRGTGQVRDPAGFMRDCLVCGGIGEI